MKTAKIVTAGKKALDAAVAEYEKSNQKPPKDGKPQGANSPPPAWKRKVINSFLATYNVHEAFVEDILGISET